MYETNEQPTDELNLSQEKKYTCPACGAKIARSVGRKCPECNTTLKYVKNNRGRVGGVYEVDGRSAVSVKQVKVDVVEVQQEWVELKTPRTNNEYKVEQNVSDSNRYKVTYQGVYQNGWVRCPSCWGKAFQNNVLHGQLEHKCKNTHPSTNRKCGAITLYVFK